MPIYELPPPGIKTAPMLQALNQGVLLQYRIEKGLFRHQNLNYQVVKGGAKDLSKKPFACIGASPLSREIIVCDPSFSPHLEAHYQKLSNLLKNNDSLYDSLSFIAAYIRQEIFSPYSSEEDLEHFLIAWQLSHPLTDFTEAFDGTLIPVIPLDDFVAARIGLCRHQAFVSTSFLERLSLDSILPPGRAYYVRDIVSTERVYGGHAWTLFVPLGSKEGWHFDPLWGLVLNIADPEDQKVLQHQYGEEAIEHETQRFLQSPP